MVTRYEYASQSLATAIAQGRVYDAAFIISASTEWPRSMVMTGIHLLGSLLHDGENQKLEFQHLAVAPPETVPALSLLCNK